MLDYVTGLIGMWIFSDAWYSLVLYSSKNEPFWKCHSIRVIRLLCGIALIVLGVLN
jgi:hypothetical protein